MISTFRKYLSGNAKDYWGMLSEEDRCKWDRVKAVYIKKFKTEREPRLIAKARPQMASLKQKREESLSQYIWRVRLTSQATTGGDRRTVPRPAVSERIGQQGRASALRCNKVLGIR